MNAPRQTPLSKEELLAEIRPSLSDDPICAVAIANQALIVARRIQQRAAQLQSPAERRQQAELDRMIQHPEDKATLTQMTDQAFRSASADRAVDQLVHILDVQGVPRFFGPLDQTLLRGFQSFGNYLPGVAVPLVKEKMRKETANVILPAERDLLREHLQARREEGVRMNVNFLGEAMLGQREAQRRLENYLAAFQMPEIECLSIKISTLYSQISTIARSETLQFLGDRLELLYRAAARNSFERPDGSQIPKFLYLDMEEYRDMALTAAAFMATLDRPGLEQVRAGIALQAYIPDSFLYQEQLTAWAQKRVTAGGGPITIRIVKGANMEMERVEASIRGWPQAPYKTKTETDANYKRMLLFGMRPERIACARLGVASHNLFEVAFALVLAAKLGVIEHVQFEMLEGMANHQRRALREVSQHLLLYAPACKKEDFIHAIGYLVRRLDENTGPENFLKHAFKISIDSPEWMRLEQLFLESAKLVDSVSSEPRRRQDRRQETAVGSTQRHAKKLRSDKFNDSENIRPPDARSCFVNEPDTDFSLPHNGLWAEQILQDWGARCDHLATDISLSIAGQDEPGEGEPFESLDPSRPGVVVARYRQAGSSQVARAVDCAQRDPVEWSRMAPAARFGILQGVAANIRVARADLIGAALADGGKTILESDTEVSEAVDFVEFYARTALDLQSARSLSVDPIGGVAVISPWNFPIAIPCGGIAAALAAGNRVILKPASDTALPARMLCECFWSAGVPHEALQFLLASGSETGKHLLAQPAIQACILTGGTETARRILELRPDLQLLAETGGKNATIVTCLSDRDMAIKNILHSAFSHAGQKCSATSLLLLEDEVFHDPGFREALIDAVASLHVGSAWELATKMGPLIRPPSGALLRSLKELEPDESWALMPEQLQGNPNLYSPSLKWNVQPGSFTHLTELFGPVLGVMRFKNLGEAIQLVHQTGYGLTSGLESLDDREQEYWMDRIRAGNLYVNRPTTGAIVMRQPFGGMGKSAFGPGIKAGGPNYIVPLVTAASIHASAPNPSEKNREDVPQSVALQAFWERMHDPENEFAIDLQQLLPKADWLRLKDAILSYDQFACEEILKSHDASRLLGQDNVRRYLPVNHLRIRVTDHDTVLEIFARAVAGIASGARIVVSHPPDVHAGAIELLDNLTDDWAGDIEFIEETDQQLIGTIAAGHVERIRYATHASVPKSVRIAANASFIHIADRSVSPHGRIELLRYVVEQSLSIDYHRYGNLGFRATEQRTEPL